LLLETFVDPAQAAVSAAYEPPAFRRGNIGRAMHFESKQMEHASWAPSGALARAR